MKLTGRDLIKLAVCRPQLRLFYRVFPGGAHVTVANLKRAHAKGLGLAWLGRETSFPQYGALPCQNVNCPICLSPFPFSAFAKHLRAWLKASRS